MLEFHPLTADNFQRFESLVMASEEIFPENIRETPESYLDALNQEGGVAFLAYCDREYAGNVVGFPPGKEQQQTLRLDETGTETDGLIYLFNIVTMPHLQGRGVGKEMLRHFLTRCCTAGFSKLGGHFRNNGSLSNIVKFGGKVVATLDDWFETGEAYCYCELDLSAGLQAVPTSPHEQPSEEPSSLLRTATGRLAAR